MALRRCEALRRCAPCRGLHLKGQCWALPRSCEGLQAHKDSRGHPRALWGLHPRVACKGPLGLRDSRTLPEGHIRLKGKCHSSSRKQLYWAMGPGPPSIRKDRAQAPRP